MYRVVKHRRFSFAALRPNVDNKGFPALVIVQSNFRRTLPSDDFGRYVLKNIRLGALSFQIILTENILYDRPE